MAIEDPDSSNTSILLYNPDFPLTNSTNFTVIEDDLSNWWALSALGLVLGTAAGNILVCLAICWERRLQNVTNYFLMSLAITDLMVAILVDMLKMRAEPQISMNTVIRRSVDRAGDGNSQLVIDMQCSVSRDHPSLAV
ncbi:unnamed protein product [Phaedon cochleariae]|uniref:G-protein coupled receptors family 1 profile domain-containing protein n=1 Tax=Phaedon cochleariae TaxID=80249 RepID=A0A9P0DEI2_PHACE|nr:unnamed protein product [Phaedon cochleariae]